MANTPPCTASSCNWQSNTLLGGQSGMRRPNLNSPMYRYCILCAPALCMSLTSATSRMADSFPRLAHAQSGSQMK